MLSTLTTVTSEKYSFEINQVDMGPVVEFSREEYKIRKVCGEKSTVVK